MRSPACIVLGAFAGLLSCRSAQAFLSASPAATTTASTAADHHQRQQSCSLPRHSSRLSSARRESLLRMAGDNGPKPEAAGPEPEAEQPAMPNVTEMMDKAAEADYVSRASTSSGGGAMGPAKQPEEDKRREREKFELNNPKQNKWASGAFKRGVALQAVVLTFVIFLSFQPEEVGNLAICAPFSKATGCVGFLEWVKIVFLGSPVPPM